MSADYERQILNGERCRAIPTKYKGYEFRSKLEATWAAFFCLLGVGWRYEPETAFYTPFGGYCPDFLIYKTGYFIEIKPDVDLLTQSERDKIGYFYNHLPENITGFIVLFGDPYQNINPTLVNGVLGVKRTEQEIKNAAGISVNTRFEGVVNLPKVICYNEMRMENDPCYEKIFCEMSKKGNLKKIITHLIFGEKKQVERIPKVSFKRKNIEHELACEKNEFVHFLKLDKNIGEVERELKSEIEALKIKPFPVDKAILIDDYITAYNTYWDFYTNAIINGGYFTKIKNPIYRVRVEVVTNMGYLGRNVRVYIKIIPKIERFSETIKELILFRGIDYNRHNIYVVMTMDQQYNEQFESNGFYVIPPSWIDLNGQN